MNVEVSMDTNLFKVSKVCWAVTSSKDPEPVAFPTIEAASDYLMGIGVPDEEIDIALVDMIASGHSRANFGATKGQFIFSDKLRLNELGVA
jgi:hypothetical protein